MADIKLNKIEDAIDAIKKGEIIIVVDDENRENEGDFIAAAEMINSSMINFMAKYGRGLICVPMSEKLCNKLDLKKMVPNNTDPFETAFTVSVDLKGNGVTSGISAADRAKTVLALVDNKTKPGDLTRPGHVFPLIARAGGVLRRTGHTEASIDFSRLAGLKSAGVLCEIMNDDGTMSRLPELNKVAKKFNLKIVSIEDLIAYRMKNDSLISKIFDENISTESSCEADGGLWLSFEDDNLDGIWNLVLSCENCNRGSNGKFSKIPIRKYLIYLADRNNWLIKSHHPLRETIIKQTGSTMQKRNAFLNLVFNESIKIFPGSKWQPETI